MAARSESASVSAVPSGMPAAAQGQRTNGSGDSAAAAERIAPPQGPVPPASERDVTASDDPAHPPLPDDPGIPEEEPLEQEPRRFRLF
jgi:uncharacterized membrane-anchored protein